MKSILKVTEYQLHEFKITVMIFYTIMFLLSLVTVLQTINITSGITVGGLEMSSAIFIFIVGLNCFKPSYKFMMANNVSRKRFYKGTTIALLISALFMSLIDAILYNVLARIIPYFGLREQLYNNGNFLSDLIWYFGVYSFLVCLGWLITMIYYRCNTIMKIIISISPVLIIFIIQYINVKTDGVFIRAIINFFSMLFGFAFNNNSFIGSASFLVGTVIILLFCILFIRKAPIKE
ncbi:MAG: hypothetical protein ACOWWH_11555 [Eubacteriaceae bacterium]